MANYKVVDAEQLDTDLASVAAAIRSKAGTSLALPFPEGFEAAINAITAEEAEAVEQAVPGITVSDSGLITATAEQEKGYVEGGTTTATKQLSVKAGTTITPGITQKIAANKGVYTTGIVYVAGNANLVAGNIKSGVSIFGVTGTYTGSGSGSGSGTTVEGDFGSVGADAIPPGFTELKGGTVTFTSQKTSVTVEHGLGGVPKGVIFYREGMANSSETYLNWAMIYPFTFYNNSSGGEFTRLLALSNGVSIRSVYGSNFTLSNTQFAVYGGSYNYSCKANTTYRWLAWR